MQSSSKPKVFLPQTKTTETRNKENYVKRGRKTGFCFMVHNILPFHYIVLNKGVSDEPKRLEREQPAIQRKMIISKTRNVDIIQPSTMLKERIHEKGSLQLGCRTVKLYITDLPCFLFNRWRNLGAPTDPGMEKSVTKSVKKITAVASNRSRPKVDNMEQRTNRRKQQE